MKLFFALLPTVFSATVFAAIVDFRIQPGTGEGPWNTSADAIIASIGDTIRFHNDDDIGHQLHTNGAPCGHGDYMAPGASWDCVTRYEFSADIEGALYDHNFGPEAAVWIEVQ